MQNKILYCYDFLKFNSCFQFVSLKEIKIKEGFGKFG